MLLTFALITPRPSLNPIGDEDIRVSPGLRISIGCKHQLLAIGRKHRKAIKRIVEGNPFQTAAINVDFVKIKIASLWIVHVGGKDYSLTVGKEVGSKVGFAVVCYLALIRAIGVHHPNFQSRGSNETLLQQAQVLGLVLFSLRVISAVNNLLAVIRPKWTTIVAQLIRQTPNVLAVTIHRVDVEITI